VVAHAPRHYYTHPQGTSTPPPPPPAAASPAAAYLPYEQYHHPEQEQQQQQPEWHDAAIDGDGAEDGNVDAGGSAGEAAALHTHLSVEWMEQQAGAAATPGLMLSNGQFIPTGNPGWLQLYEFGWKDGGLHLRRALVAGPHAPPPPPHVLPH
jgi:hypothetical protein